MTAFSILDLSPIPEGGDAALALHNSLDLAQHAERWGYRRYWIAEHHNMPGIATAATAVVIAYLANATSTIRVGAGGIMLPNHAPLVIAEQFGTLATLFPGRIDLGLRRAPGTDPRTSHALRRNLESDVNAFPRDVVELQHYFREAEPGQRVRAVPGVGLEVPIWILGSSLFGAQLAATLGLPYAFASHFAPAALLQAVETYRSRFEPSAELSEPYVMVGSNVFAAATVEEKAFCAPLPNSRFCGCGGASPVCCRLRSQALRRDCRRLSARSWTKCHRARSSAPRARYGLASRSSLSAPARMRSSSRRTSSIIALGCGRSRSPRRSCRSHTPVASLSRRSETATQTTHDSVVQLVPGTHRAGARPLGGEAALLTADSADGGLRRIVFSYPTLTYRLLQCCISSLVGVG